MALHVTYDEDIDSIVIKVVGVAVYEEILFLRDQILNHSRFKTNINQLFDCSEGELDLVMSDLKKIASHYMDVADKLGQFRKLALVVSRDLDYGMMRQYESFFDSGPGVSLYVFRSLFEARDWLTK